MSACDLFQQFPGMSGGPEGGMGMGPDMGQVMNGGEQLTWVEKL